MTLDWGSLADWVIGIVSCGLAIVFLAGILFACSPTTNADLDALDTNRRPVRDTHRRRDPSQEPALSRDAAPVPEGLSTSPVPRHQAPVVSPCRMPGWYIGPWVSSPPAPLHEAPNRRGPSHETPLSREAVSKPPPELERIQCKTCGGSTLVCGLFGECGVCFRKGRRSIWVPPTPAPPTGIHSGEPGASCIRKAEQLESIGDPTSKYWRKGAEGERATASLLRRELPDWSCRHDLSIPNSRANIDHIATAPDGRSVCIDSKNWASWDMERLKKAVETLKWEAKEGAKIVGTPVEPVIVMHGSYDGGPDRVDGVRVLHSTAIGQL